MQLKGGLAKEKTGLLGQDVLRNTRCQLDSWVWEKGEVLGSLEVWGCELEGVLSKYFSFGL